MDVRLFCEIYHLISNEVSLQKELTEIVEQEHTVPEGGLLPCHRDGNAHRKF